MQFIEVSGFTGVRSARLRYRRRGSQLEFVLFPMIHLGEARFYEEVTEHLRDCDLIVAENAPVQGTGAAALTRSQDTLAGGDGRLGLVPQSIDYRTLGVPVVVPEIPAQEMARGWKRLSRLDRLAIQVAAPVVALGYRHFATRADIARHLQSEQVLTADDVDRRESWDELYDLILDRRDKYLLAGLRDLHEERRDRAERIAVVWGAGHMRAVSRGLRALGYRCVDADWMTVFTYDDE